VEAVASALAADERSMNQVGIDAGTSGAYIHKLLNDSPVTSKYHDNITQTLRIDMARVRALEPTIEAIVARITDYDPDLTEELLKFMAYLDSKKK